MWAPNARRKYEKMLGDVAKLSATALRLESQGGSEHAIQIVRKASARLQAEAAELYSEIKKVEDSLKISLDK